MKVLVSLWILMAFGAIAFVGVARHDIQGTKAQRIIADRCIALGGTPVLLAHDDTIACIDESAVRWTEATR